MRALLYLVRVFAFGKSTAKCGAIKKNGWKEVKWEAKLKLSMYKNKNIA
jgi:hypothetical protein